MNKRQFRQNMVDALEFHDAEISNEEMETFLDLNYDEDSSITDWTFADFNSFAIDIKTEGIARACRLNDLQFDDDDEDEYDDRYFVYMFNNLKDRYNNAIDHHIQELVSEGETDSVEYFKNLPKIETIKYASTGRDALEIHLNRDVATNEEDDILENIGIYMLDTENFIECCSGFNGNYFEADLWFFQNNGYDIPDQDEGDEE